MINGWQIQISDALRGSITYDQTTNPADYIITDLGGGTREFQALTFGGSLFNMIPKPSSVNATIYQSTIYRPGWIYRRIEPIVGVDVPCDFRAVKQYRYLIDKTQYPERDG
jgi:hypothetical protein